MRRIGVAVVVALGLTLAIDRYAPPAWSQLAPSGTATDRRTLSEARLAAQKYWNAQKTSDEKLFRSVTPHEGMSVVFAWSFVRESDIQVETGLLDPVRDDLRSCMESAIAARKAEAEGLHATGEASLTSLREASEHSKIAAQHATTIGKVYPFFGDFLQRGYWMTITPPNIGASRQFQLMGYEYIVDVEFQSTAGMSLKKRVPTILRRLVVDKQDSGWKVFFTRD